MSEDERRLEAFRPIRLRKAADEVVVVLIDAIRGGLFQPGDRLPRERDLALRLDVARTTVREGVAMLLQAGAVSVRRGAGGGIFVASTARLPELLETIHGRPEASVRSLLELRRTLMLQAIFLAAERATPEELTLLRELLERLRPLVDDDDEFTRVSMQLHVRIGELGRNEVLVEALNSLLSRYQVVLAQYPVGHTDLTESLATHERLLAAIESKSRRRMIAALDAHFGRVEEYLIGTRLRFP